MKFTSFIFSLLSLSLSLSLSCFHYFRFFFKTVYEGIEEALMEEISDDETVLPHYEGKIVARVESVA